MDSSNSINEQVIDKPSKKIVKKRRRLRPDFWELIFMIFSIVFILGCCFFYGNRLLKYYRIYNPKPENGETVKLLSNSITETSSIVSDGEGLYRLSGAYIYKGKEVNNYLKFSGFLFRIIKINGDGSIRMILDDDLNSLFYDKKSTDYIKSDLNTYLNDVFLKYLDVDKLVKSSVCLDQVNNLNSVTCNEVNTDYYVSLPNITDFLNSKDTKSYMLKGTSDTFWLSSSTNDEVWHTSGLNLAKDKVTNAYQVKPVITLKNSNVLYGGTGTKDDPYIVEKDQGKINVGSYVMLDDDLYLIYDYNKDNLSLVLASLYKDGNTKYRFSLENNTYDLTQNSSLAKYLNTTFLESLSYKDLILDSKWYTGAYVNGYEDVYKEETDAKVGMLNVLDFKFSDIDMPYFLITGSSDKDKVYMYDKGQLVVSKVPLARAFRPAIKISQNNIKSGSGTKDDPYKVVK